MKLTVTVKFSVQEDLGVIAPETPFKTIEELRNYVSSQQEELMYSLTVNRSCIVFDAASHPSTRQQLNLPTEKFRFFVSNKLLYLRDVKRYLQKDSTLKTLNIQVADKIKQDTPVLFRELAYYPYSDSPKKKRENRFDVRPLTEQDVVVDKKLNQIWPEKTGKLPVGLVELLAKQTEKVYQY